MALDAGGSQGVRARAWCRADLAGGTLDIWPLGLLHRGARTVNVALDLAVEVELTARRRGYRLQQGESVVEVATASQLAADERGALVGLILQGLELDPVSISVRSASPRGGGLGASSALTVAMIAAAETLRGEASSSTERRAALARDLEARLMGLPTGRQDHYPALLGGLLEIRHRLGGESVRRLEVDLEPLRETLVVAYSGESHFSAGNNWRIIQRRLEGDPDTIRCFEGIRDAAEQVVEALEDSRLAEVGELMAVEWSWRRRLAEGISTPAIERLLDVARQAGAWGGKACGAGGGGCVVLLCPPERRQPVVRALSAAGGRELPTRPVDRPLEVEELER